PDNADPLSHVLAGLGGVHDLFASLHSAPARPMVAGRTRSASIRRVPVLCEGLSWMRTRTGRLASRSHQPCAGNDYSNNDAKRPETARPTCSGVRKSAGIRGLRQWQNG